MKKLLCAVLSGIMAFSTLAVAVPITASAAESQASVSATYGDFEYALEYDYLEDDYTCTIKKYNGYALNVTIPSTIYGYKVTAIGEGAFSTSDDDRFEEVVSKIKSITIPDSVTSIGNDAFTGCNSLAEITIPDGVTSIGGYAFSSCSSLAKITIPNSVTSIGYGAFDETKWLENKPDGVVYIGNYVYEYKGDMPENTKIELKQGTKSIGTYAFAGCSSLAEITIPNSVTSIGDDAFSGCSSLAEITIPNSVTSIGSSAFAGCSSLAEITIPNSVTSIGYGAFSGCSSLAKITILNSVTSIGKGAFDETKWLENKPDGVVYIGNHVYEYKGDMPENTKIELKQGTKSIGDGAFSGCSSLAEITIPNSVTSIGGDAFSGCSSLAEITIPNSVTSIDVCAFSGCSSLAEITIPDGVTSIGYGAFANCSSLAKITIPNSVTSIGTGAFFGCNSLAEITIPDSVISIGAQAFQNCKKLSKVNLPSSLKEIGMYAFCGCKNLTNISIPNNLKIVGAMAFCDCNLSQINLPKSVTEIQEYALGYNDLYPDSNLFEPVKIKNFKIYGYKNTAAETYAKENGFNFIENSAPTSVSLNKTSLALEIGKTYTLIKTVSPSNAVTSYTWSSSNTSVATVDKNGKVTAKASGTATITVKTSNGKTATCKVTVNLPTPQITGLANTTGGIKISWNKVSGAYGYRLYYKPASGGWKRFKDTTATSFTDSGVSPNRTETYTIRCIDKDGNTISGFNSNGWSKKYTPVAPTVSKLENTSGGIKLSWNKITGVYGYRVYQKTSNGWKRIKDTTATSYTDSSVSANQTKTYTIRCIDKNGNTVSGYNSKGWSITYTPVAPTITKLTNTSKGVSVTWNKIAGVYGYRLYRKYDGGSWTKVKDTTATSFTDSGAKKGKKVTYTVRCIDKNGKTISGYNSTGWSITRK